MSIKDNLSQNLCEGNLPTRNNYIARLNVLERHADGAFRSFTVTRSINSSTTVAELYAWRESKIHDPVNGEFASREILITPDESFADY